MTGLWAFILIIIFHASLIAQISDDFSDGDITEYVTWYGDREKFMVNSEGHLQLNDNESGKALLYTPVFIPDSVSWKAEIRLHFAPSDNNNLILFLALDTFILSEAKGFYIKIGQNGSSDAVELYEQNKDTQVLLASGHPGSVASEPVHLDLYIQRHHNGLMTVLTKQANEVVPTVEFELDFDSELFNTTVYFGILCTYTASRSDKFYFDNIEISPLWPDTTGPMLQLIEVINSTRIRIHFDEILDRQSALDGSNYLFTPELHVREILISNDSPASVYIELEDALPGGIVTQLSLKGISDANGNLSPTMGPFDLILIENPGPGDLLINEVLFDPEPGVEDFIELINNSGKFLRLDTLLIKNTQNNQTVRLGGVPFLPPGKIIAITENPGSLKAFYNPPLNATIYENALPPFNNDSGNITVLPGRKTDENPIDSMDYRDDMHFDLLRETEGVSLERLSTQLGTNDPSNWHSAASAYRHATPGYPNSTTFTGSTSGPSPVNLPFKTFSPNSDGEKDQLIIQYRLDKPGYLANFTIYDDQGRNEDYLFRNFLMPIEGILTWDGTINGRVGKIGIYIIYYEIFHPDGDVFTGKLACVLADHL